MYTDRTKDYTTELFNYNKHLLSAVRTQKSSDVIKNTKAVTLLNDIDIALTNQLNTMESFDGLLNESKMDQFKENAARVLGTIAGSIGNIREDAVSKMIRDNYTALSMTASGYTMLNTLAISNKNDELANFAADSLERLAQLITETSKVLPFVVADELVDDRKEAERIGEQSLKETQLAWKPEHLFEGE